MTNIIFSYVYGHRTYSYVRIYGQNLCFYLETHSTSNNLRNFDKNIVLTGAWMALKGSSTHPISFTIWNFIWIKYCPFFLFSLLLLIHEGSHREVYQEFQPSYDIFRMWCQRLFRFRAPPAYTAQLQTLHQRRANNQLKQLIKSSQLF